MFSRLNNHKSKKMIISITKTIATAILIWKLFLLVLWWKANIPTTTPKTPPAREMRKNQNSGILLDPIFAVILSKPIRRRAALLTSRR